MEAVGPLLLLDDDATFALPYKVSIFCLNHHMSSERRRSS